MTVRYFAYGSNLLYARLYARCSSIVNIGVARLDGHRLHFNKPGGDDSGKCGIEVVETEEYVLGVLYQMDKREKPVLDRIEGIGHGYIDQKIQVRTEQGIVECFTYYPTRLDRQIRPFDWYKAFVLEGARENRFPAHYLGMIASIEALVDPHHERRSSNYAIISAKSPD
ncbi:MAG: gamma-glutamylcyclotransferase family protein [bacterium]